MHTRPDYKMFNAGQRITKGLSISKYRAKHRYPTFIPIDEGDTNEPIHGGNRGTCFIMNMHGLPNGYGVARMRVTYYVTFRGQARI